MKAGVFALVAALAGTGAFAADGAAAPATTKAAPASVLFDANGKKMGNFFPVNGVNGYVHTYLNGRAVFFGVYLRLDGATLAPVPIYDYEYLYYLSTNCTGAPHVRWGMYATVLLSQAGVATAYVGEGAAAYTAYRSRRLGPSCESNLGQNTLTPVAFELDLSTVFAEPYRLR